MPTKPDEGSSVLIEKLNSLPEHEALECYSQLTPQLQWFARQRTAGKRRQALIRHHAITMGQCR
jgi:hypothetical protein